MNNNSNHVKTPLQENVELIAKMGTVTVVILYIFGLLVTNAQLMALGIADFSALQARFVSIGALFLFYVCLLIGLPTAFVLAFRFAYKYSCRMSPAVWKRIVFLVIMVPIAVLIIVLLYGSLLSYLYPWGPSYESQWSVAFNPHEQFIFLQFSFLLIQESFFHVKTFIGGCLGCGVVFLLTSNISGQMRLFFLATYSLTSITLILFGYSQSVFPNFPYNLGGGQPRIVQFHMRENDLPLLNVNGLATKSHQRGLKSSVPLALWHQDTFYMYVTPVDTKKPRAMHLTAISTDAVAVLTYLKGYVKVSNGDQIIEVHRINE